MSKYWTCESCNCQVTRHHKASHLKTKKHTRVDITGGDLQSSKTTSSILKPFTTEKYPGERHLFRHNYTGPGTRLDIRLDENNNPKQGEEPINRIDQAALKHDIAYNSEDLRDRHVADVNLIHDLNNIQNPSSKEKIQRALVKLAMKGKIFIGAGLPRKAKDVANKRIIEQADVERSLENQLFENKPLQTPTESEIKYANELHHEFRKNKKYLKVQVHEKDQTWSADLVFMPTKSSDPEKYKIILTVIDLYTRFAFARCLENKTGYSITEAFENIFEQHQRIPKYLWCDKGTEFYNKVFTKFLNENDIKLYSTENEGKAVVVERLNRTLKNKMWKYFTAIGKQKWNNELLQKIVNEYNNDVHSSIKSTPLNASLNPETVKVVNIENDVIVDTTPIKPKFKIGDRVRIFKYKNKFEKGFTAKWTNEIFIINKIHYTTPITYSIIDLNNEKILGRFYNNELQKTDF